MCKSACWPATSDKHWKSYTTQEAKGGKAVADYVFLRRKIPRTAIWQTLSLFKISISPFCRPVWALGRRWMTASQGWPTVHWNWWLTVDGPDWGSLPKRPVCHLVSMRGLYLLAFSLNIDFEISSYIMFKLLNITNNYRHIKFMYF